MSATGVTFKCGGCGNLMAVGEELRGQRVRCPHCMQVVQVPAAELEPASQRPDTAAQAAVPAPPVSAPPSPAEEPVIHVASAEVDNIFAPAESAGDELFQRDPLPVLQMPPPAEPLPKVEVPPTDLMGVESKAASPPPVADHTVAYAPPEHEVGLQAPPADGAGVAPAPPVESSVENPPVQEAPWAPDPLMEAAAAAAPSAVSLRPRPRTRGLSAAATWLAMLIPYALTVTAVCVLMGLGIITLPWTVRGKHPLEDLPDQGVYQELNQEGARPRAIDPNSTLPADFEPIKLDELRKIGDLGIKPLRVARERINYLYFHGRRNVTGEEALVLYLELKNIAGSENRPSKLGLVFHPYDPTFNRAFVPGVPSYTYLEILGNQYYGAISDVYSERVEGQKFEELLPGETMETMVIARFSKSDQQKAVRALESVLKTDAKDKPLTWRVHLRKGRDKVTLRGETKELWLTTVVAISFLPTQVEVMKEQSSEE